MSVEDMSKYEQSHRTKKHNPVFDGLQIRGCSQIQKVEEIPLHYNPKELMADTARILGE